MDSKLCLNGDPENCDDLIRKLRRMIEEKRELKILKTDISLLRSLRVCDYNIKKAYSQLYYLNKFLNNHPEFVQGFDDRDNLRRITQMNIGGILPNKDKNGVPVYFFHYKNWDTTSTNLEDLVKAALWGMLSVTEIEEYQRTGLKVVVDASGIGFQHFRAVGIHYSRLGIEFAEKCLPCKINEIHIVNENYIFSYLYNLFAYLSTIFRHKVIFHGRSREKLFESFPQEILPEEVGGTAGPFSSEYSWSLIKPVQLE